MNTEQEIKSIKANLDRLYSELDVVKGMALKLAQLPDGIIGNSSDSPYVKSDNNDPNHYLPKVGEVVLVWHRFLGQRIRVFLRYEKDKSEPYVCIDGELNDSAVRKYIDGCKPVECTWSRCRRLNGEIIEFGCDAKQAERIESEQPSPYQVDWTNAPEWADVHAFDGDGSGYWYGACIMVCDWIGESKLSPFRLPNGLDWKLSKTTRPC